MKRENIFKLLESNYNPEKEIKKIKEFLNTNYLFCKCKKNGKDENVIADYLFENFFDRYLFSKYKYKGTCLSVSEFYKNSNAYIDKFSTSITSDIIINFLEVTENLLKLYFDKMHELYEKQIIKYYGETYEQLRFLMDTLEKKLAIKKKTYKDKIILYVGSYKSETALEKVEEEDLAIELIKYDRESLSYKEKRKVLKQLDILVQPITDKIIQSQRQNKDIQYHIADDLNFIFNNFELRHSNLNVKSKDYKPNLKKFKDIDFDSIYDIAYELILDLLIFNSYNDSLKICVKGFKKKLNGVKK